jgi:hypothetical protein
LTVVQVWPLHSAPQPTKTCLGLTVPTSHLVLGQSGGQGVWRFCRLHRQQDRCCSPRLMRRGPPRALDPDLDGGREEDLAAGPASAKGTEEQVKA